MTHDQRGFSLVETVVAVGLLAGAVTGLLSLFTLTTAANTGARHASMATMLAGAKLEELRALPAPPAGGPPASLTTNTAGYCDLLDQHGARLGGCTTASQRAPYVRRWSIEPRTAGPVGFTVLRVAVSWQLGATRSAWTGLHADEVQLATLRVEGFR